MNRRTRALLLRAKEAIASAREEAPTYEFAGVKLLGPLKTVDPMSVAWALTLDEVKNVLKSGNVKVTHSERGPIFYGELLQVLQGIKYVDWNKATPAAFSPTTRAIDVSLENGTYHIEEDIPAVMTAQTRKAVARTLRAAAYKLKAQ